MQCCKMCDVPDGPKSMQKDSFTYSACLFGWVKAFFLVMVTVCNWTKGSLLNAFAVWVCIVILVDESWDLCLLANERKKILRTVLVHRVGPFFSFSIIWLTVGKAFVFVHDSWSMGFPVPLHYSDLFNVWGWCPVHLICWFTASS